MKNNKTKKLALSAVLCAAGVLVMLVGSVIDVMDLSVAALASFLVIIAVFELGSIYPTLIWAVTSLLGLLLLPNKLPALYFALFFGWYPQAKIRLERLSAVLCWVLKLSCFALSLTLITLVSSVFFPTEELLPLSALLYVGVTVVFVIFDIALSRVISAYTRVWRHKIKKIL